MFDVQILVHFGQAKAWAEDDLKAASLFLPLASFFRGMVPLCLELTTGLSH